MRLTALIAIAGLLLAVFAPVALCVSAVPAISGLSGEVVLVVDVCHADAPFVSMSGLAPCLIESGYVPQLAPGTVEMLHPGQECLRTLPVSPLFRPPITA